MPTEHECQHLPSPLPNLPCDIMAFQHSFITLLTWIDMPHCAHTCTLYAIAPSFPTSFVRETQQSRSTKAGAT